MICCQLRSKKKCVELPETSKQQFDSSYSIQRILRNLWIDQDVVQLTSLIPIFRARFAVEKCQSKSYRPKEMNQRYPSASHGRVRGLRANTRGNSTLYRRVQH